MFRIQIRKHFLSFDFEKVWVLELLHDGKHQLQCNPVRLRVPVSHRCSDPNQTWNKRMLSTVQDKFAFLSTLDGRHCWLGADVRLLTTTDQKINQTAKLSRWWALSCGLPSAQTLGEVGPSSQHFWRSEESLLSKFAIFKSFRTQWLGQAHSSSAGILVVWPDWTVQFWTSF